MKNIFAIALLISTRTFAAGGYFDELNKDLCPGMWKDSHNVICWGSKNSKEILKLKISKANQVSVEEAGKKIKHLQINDAFTLGVLPDDSTANIYGYVYLLKDASGRLVGYVAIDGYVNHEMEVKLQITASYNLNGEMVKATVQEKN